MEVTHADSDDITDLLDLWLELAEGQRAYGSHILVEENSTRIHDSIAHCVASERLLVARDDELIGFVMFRTQTRGYEQDITRGFIDNVYVVPERRREGVGSALLAAAERELRNHEVDAVGLQVMAANDDARRFYRERGYGDHRVELEKSLDDY